MMALLGIPAIVVIITLALLVLVIGIRVPLLIMAVAVIVMTLLGMPRHDCVCEGSPGEVRSDSARLELLGFWVLW